jgi:bifunctional DNA-binding transcriptional regulator/antitoxin component of YhaV-PrlF toxin-antitoxin module
MVHFKMRVSTRGRVTIPKPLQELLGIGPGAETGLIPRGEEVQLIVKSRGGVQDAGVKRHQGSSGRAK